MIPAIRRETVDVQGWMSEIEITDCIAVSQSLPGAFAVNAAIFIGKQVKGLRGALAACLGLTLPAFLSIVLILIFLGQVKDNVYVVGAFEGIKAASAGLILVTVYQMGRVAINRISGYFIAAGSFALIVLLQVSAVWAILAGGLVGYLEYQYGKKKRKEEG